MDEYKKNDASVGENADVLSSYVEALKDSRRNGILNVPISDCLEITNKGKTEKDQITSSAYGIKMKSMGFISKRDTRTGRKIVDYDRDLIESQCRSYNLDISWVNEETAE